MKAHFDKDNIIKQDEDENFQQLKHPKNKHSSKKNVEIHELDTTLYENILGKDFINSKLEPVLGSEVFNAPVICLLFTSHWSNPCFLLGKDLLELYQESNQGIKNLEIIQCTLEREFVQGEKQEVINEVKRDGEIKFKAFINEKPWIFINYNDERNEMLKERYSIKYVPQLWVLKKDLSVLTRDGRKELANEGPCVSERWMKMIENS